MRKRNPFVNDLRSIALPILLSVVIVTWSAVAERSWLFTVVLAVVAVTALPAVDRVRLRRGTAVAVLVQLAVLVVGWFVALLVTLPFTTFN